MKEAQEKVCWPLGQDEEGAQSVSLKVKSPNLSQERISIKCGLAETYGRKESSVCRILKERESQTSFAGMPQTAEAVAITHKCLVER